MATAPTPPLDAEPPSPTAIETPPPISAPASTSASTSASASRSHKRRVWYARALLFASLLVVIWVAYCFGRSFPRIYGLSNQNSYLVEGLKLFDGSLANDWYTSQTTSFHFAFAYVSYALFKVARTGWPFIWANMAANAGLAVAIYGVASALVPRRQALATFLLVMTIVFATRTNGPAGSYIIGEIFQPSTLGAISTVAALACFLRGRWILSGVFLACGGIFHSNYMVLGLGALTIAHLLLGKKDLFQRLLRQIGPTVPVLLLMGPFLVKGALDPNGAAARQILFTIRAPHHFSPKAFEAGIVTLAAWTMLGLGAGGFLLRGEIGKARRLRAFMIALLGMIWGGAVMTAAFKSQTAQHLFIWRLAPISDLLFQILFCAGFVRAAARPSVIGSVSQVSGRSALLVIVGAAILGILWGNRTDLTSTTLLRVGVWMFKALAFVVVLWAIGMIARRPAALTKWVDRARRLVMRHRMWPVLLASLYVCYNGALKSFYEKLPTFQFRGITPAERELAAWVSSNTPKEALFLTPPTMETFRLHAARAIVVDWKSPPFLPTELMEWYRRINDVSGRRVNGRGDLNGYRDLDAGRAVLLKKSYGFDYIVALRSSPIVQSKAFPALWEGAAYAVLDARGAPQQPPAAPTPSQPAPKPPEDPNDVEPTE